MARLFDISTNTDVVTIPAGGSARVIYSVTNSTPRPQRALMKARVLDAGQSGWLTLEGDVERSFGPGALQQVVLGIAVPPGTPAGRFRVRIDALSESNPNDDFTESPVVAVSVAAGMAVPAAKTPGWLWIVIAIGVLAIAGAVAWLATRHKAAATDSGQSGLPAQPVQPQSHPVSVAIDSNAVPPQPHPAVGTGVSRGAKLLGGGAWIDWRGAGAMLTDSFPNAGGWAAAGKDHLASDPSSLTAYALGLRDPDDAWQTTQVDATVGVAEHPVARASLPSGYVLVGGGCQVHVGTGAPGSLLTASFPASATTWECRAKDHGLPSPAALTAFVIGLRPRDAGAPLPEVLIDRATSAVAQAPEIQVRPSRSGFTVVGGGARADFSEGQAGQLLTRSGPLPPESGETAPAGWIARSKDHMVAFPGTVTAFVISVKFPR